MQARDVGTGAVVWRNGKFEVNPRWSDSRLRVFFKRDRTRDERGATSNALVCVGTSRHVRGQNGLFAKFAIVKFALLGRYVGRNTIGRVNKTDDDNNFLFMVRDESGNVAFTIDASEEARSSVVRRMPRTTTASKTPLSYNTAAGSTSSRSSRS
jgi:hypothetical protein